MILKVKDYLGNEKDYFIDHIENIIVNKYLADSMLIFKEDSGGCNDPLVCRYAPLLKESDSNIAEYEDESTLNTAVRYYISSYLFNVNILGYRTEGLNEEETNKEAISKWSIGLIYLKRKDHDDETFCFLRSQNFELLTDEGVLLQKY